MARIGVGVPTYNRSSYLRESLICLQMQRAEFSVLVIDNASTDDTKAVFDATVGADRRFSYLRHPSNIPALENFYACLNALPTEYFMWRADDDLSADNYLEELAAALDKDSGADLAVSPFMREKPGREPERLKLPIFPVVPPADRAEFVLRHSEPTWIYGLWRREALLANVARLRGEYDYAWASDHALMLPTFVAGRVTGCQSTWFHQRILGGATYGLAPSDQLRAREDYADYAQKLVARLGSDAVGRPGLRNALESHINRHVGRVWQLRRRMLKQTIRRFFAITKDDAVGR